MSYIQYAVCHFQRGSDSGMSCHIERKEAKGKTYVPDNADAKRTHLNRELIKFPQEVANRTEAILYRIEHAGLHRKVGKNQIKAIRIILTGTHDQMLKYEDDIERLQAEVEKTREGRSKILSFFGTGELAEAKKQLSNKYKQIEKLQHRISQLEQEQQQLKEQYKKELAKYRNGYMAEIDKAIKRAEIAERKLIAHEATIEKQKQCIDTLDRKANPHRYHLSSRATLTGIRMSPRHSNIHSLRIQTKVENVPLRR